MRKATIKDVAKHAGVSTATVSYVLNGVEGKVSQETVEKIYKAIKELNYIQNFSAVSLVKKKSRLLGVIIPQTEDCKQLLLENPFYSEMISGIELKAREMGYHIILSGVDKGQSYLDVSVQRDLDGAIIMGIYQERFYEELKNVKIPIVLVDSYIHDKYFYKVGIDDEFGGYLATRHLIRNGHKKIALVTGSIRKDGVVEKRFLGYKKALREAGLFYNPDDVFENSVTYQHGLKIGRFLSETPRNITAVFATADLIALGVIRGMIETGKRVPEDYSVIGFDDIPISRIFIPSLTTIKQDIGDKGAKAAALLIQAIEEKTLSEPTREVLLTLDVIERQTVKNISIKD
ncbi:MAG: LacI family transcriptional regulator [Clostridia bacterium]|nr:LacI family transcriptional regulator [Clostridia bacterium]